MGKKEKTAQKQKEEEIEEQLKLLDQEYSFWFLFNVHVHKLVYLLSIACLVFDIMDAVNLIWYKKYVTLTTVAIRTLFDLLLLIGNRKYKQWMFVFFLFSKIVQSCLVVFYMIYLTLTVTDVIKHSERFDKYLVTVERTPDAIAGAYVALLLLLLLLGIVIYLVVRDYYYIGKRKEITVDSDDD
ncbi:unnamed protein product [Bursaphelenchus okinawaensis]|uniref:Uncharacterized protein n=1 Tax=Bursaphelenchus okinawaensis TaxID=465554 RepID=A0A811KLY2_9BILA|nr:unnamed protein product [Bursaphelenchus okinawaensis]CAG9105691.1 unnamed protein product [Bursaphelenchus okinawaensis]